MRTWTFHLGAHPLPSGKHTWEKHFLEQPQNVSTGQMYCQTQDMTLWLSKLVVVKLPLFPPHSPSQFVVFSFKSLWKIWVVVETPLPYAEVYESQPQWAGFPPPPALLNSSVCTPFRSPCLSWVRATSRGLSEGLPSGVFQNYSMNQPIKELVRWENQQDR